MGTIYAFLDTGKTIEDYLTEPTTNISDKRRKRSTRTSYNLIDEHKSYIEKLSSDLKKTNVPEVSVEYQFIECREVKAARQIARDANSAVDETMEYIHKRRKFWEMFK